LIDFDGFSGFSVTEFGRTEKTSRDQKNCATGSSWKSEAAKQAAFLLMPPKPGQRVGTRS